MVHDEVHVTHEAGVSPLVRVFAISEIFRTTSFCHEDGTGKRFLALARALRSLPADAVARCLWSNREGKLEFHWNDLVDGLRTRPDQVTVLLFQHAAE